MVRAESSAPSQRNLRVQVCEEPVEAGGGADVGVLSSGAFRRIPSTSQTFHNNPSEGGRRSERLPPLRFWDCV